MGLAASTLPLPAGRAETVRRAVSVLRDGGVIAVPTDTVYGLVALFDNETGVRKIFDLKRRPQQLPLPILLGTAAELPLVAAEIPPEVWPLVHAFWPGPLTIVLKAKTSVPSQVTAGTGTVGVRVPDHDAVLDLLEATSWPFASTSANAHGSPPLTTAGDVARELGDTVDLIIDGVPGSGTPSTVVDLCREPFVIRRQGAITASQIRKATGARTDIGPAGQ